MLFVMLKGFILIVIFLKLLCDFVFFSFRGEFVKMFET
jgi:hypothetical protein